MNIQRAQRLRDLKRTSYFLSVILVAMLLGGFPIAMLSGCKQRPDNTIIADKNTQNTAIDNDETNNASNVTNTDAKTVHPVKQEDIASTPQVESAPPASTRNTPIEIDWSQIDSKVSPVATETFTYPMAKDSAAVQNYANFFDISPSDAQHSLTVGTASNEPLSGLLDQLGDSYVSHTLTDGKDNTLIIHTTPNVSASQYDYVIENDFARGLILPIKIEPIEKTQPSTN